MCKYKIGTFFTKKDIVFNLEDFPKESNVIFVTGLFGSGKSTMGKDLSSALGAVHLQQDWLTWSDVYNDPICDYFVEEFKNKNPETSILFENKWWHGYDHITREQKREYRRRFDRLMFETAVKSKDKIFVFEGASLYNHQYTAELMMDKPIVIKRTGMLTSLKRMCKRDFGKVSLGGMHKLWKTHRKQWTVGRAKLNSYILQLVKQNGKDKIDFIKSYKEIGDKIKQKCSFCP